MSGLDVLLRHSDTDLVHTYSFHRYQSFTAHAKLLMSHIMSQYYNACLKLNSLKWQ